MDIPTISPLLAIILALFVSPIQSDQAVFMTTNEYIGGFDVVLIEEYDDGGYWLSTWEDDQWVPQQAIPKEGSTYAIEDEYYREEVDLTQVFSRTTMGQLERFRDGKSDRLTIDHPSGEEIRFERFGSVIHMTLELYDQMTYLVHP